MFENMCFFIEDYGKQIFDAILFKIRRLVFKTFPLNYGFVSQIWSDLVHGSPIIRPLSPLPSYFPSSPPHQPPILCRIPFPSPLF